MRFFRDYVWVAMIDRSVNWLCRCVAIGFLLASGSTHALDNNYRVVSGDVLRVTVFQNPELTLDVRVHESGYISFPLLGKVMVAGTSLEQTEQKIATSLKTGGYVRDPQVSVMLQQPFGNQVTVLGHVSRPGRYPLMVAGMRLTDVLAMAGGATAEGGDIAVIVGQRDGQPLRTEVDIPRLFSDNSQGNLIIAAGDSVYVERAPVFYIYGEIQRPGAYRVVRNMTIMQAVATGGGLTQRGTEKGIHLYRRTAAGELVKEPVTLDATITGDDVIYVGESFF